MRLLYEEKIVLCIVLLVPLVILLLLALAWAEEKRVYDPQKSIIVPVKNIKTTGKKK